LLIIAKSIIWGSKVGRKPQNRTEAGSGEGGGFRKVTKKKGSVAKRSFANKYTIYKSYVKGKKQKQ